MAVSICVIAKNEEKNLEEFFACIHKTMDGFPYEIIFVDTGSTDRTKELARAHVDGLYEFPWENDFSKARNFSIEKANNDWILVLDCDENILTFNPKRIQAIMDNESAAIGTITCYNHNIADGVDSRYSVQLDRFFNRKFFHYEGIIHEQLAPNHEGEYETVKTFIEVDHSGYTGTRVSLEEKANRNINLLTKMLEDNPEDSYLYFQLGQAYRMAKNAEQACYYFAKGLECPVNPELEYVQIMVISYGNALLDLERYGEALELEKVYDEFDKIADFLCLMGLIYLRTGFVAEAIREFTKATTAMKTQVEGANTFIPYYNLGCIYEAMGEIEQAKKLYGKCGEFSPARERLQLLQKEN